MKNTGDLDPQALSYLLRGRASTSLHSLVTPLLVLRVHPLLREGWDRSPALAGGRQEVVCGAGVTQPALGSSHENRRVTVPALRPGFLGEESPVPQKPYIEHSDRLAFHGACKKKKEKKPSKTSQLP